MSMEGIFSGVRVVELAQYVFVPGASVLLADQGAEVIHVETPGSGDPYRNLRIGDGREVGAVNLAMEQNNRGKKSIALDLKSPAGREAFLMLIETADVFLTSLRPKAITALGLDVDDLRARNSKIIYVRGNGLGFKGEEANKPGFDASSFWARGGMCYAMTVPGQQPPSPRPALGDHTGSMGLAFGIAGALYKRAMTGEPSLVETSLLSTAVWVLSSDVTYSQAPGYKTHGGRASRSSLTYTYTTRDERLIQLMLLDPRPYWAPLCEMLELTELINDKRFHDNEARRANSEVLIDLIQAKIGARDWSHWEPLFNNWDAPWELIRTIDDISEDPQVLANDMVFPMTLNNEEIRLVAGPVAFEGRAAPLNVRSSPGMGEHTADLLAEVGFSADDIESLRKEGIAQ